MEHATSHHFGQTVSQRYHTFVRASLMHGRYYVTEHDLSCLLLRNTRESEEAANTAHIEESENRDHDDKFAPLLDVTYDEAERHKNSLLAASLEMWNTGGHHSLLLTREIPMHRMVEARATITREISNLQLNTENIPLVNIDRLLQLTERNEEIQKTAAPTGKDSLTSTYSRPIRHSQYAEYEYLTEEEEVKPITGSSMMDWTSGANARRRRAVMEENARQRDADFETYSQRVNNLSFR